MRLVMVMLLGAIVFVAGPTAPPVSAVALAQDIPEMPALGTVVLGHALANDGPLRPRSCPTGRNSTAYTEATLEMKVTGRCTDSSSNVCVGSSVVDLAAANGDFSIDVKVGEGYDRAWVGIAFREQTSGDLYVVNVVPARR